MSERLSKFARIEAQDRAERIAFQDLLGFVRDARVQGWDPVAFVPPVCWRLQQAIRQAIAWDELEREGSPAPHSPQILEKVKL